jgi:hypothetical protein
LVVIRTTNGPPPTVIRLVLRFHNLFSKNQITGYVSIHGFQKLETSNNWA